MTEPLLIRRARRAGVTAQDDLKRFTAMSRHWFKREKEAQAENARLGVQHSKTKASTQAQTAHTVIA